MTPTIFYNLSQLKKKIVYNFGLNIIFVSTTYTQITNNPGFNNL